MISRRLLRWGALTGWLVACGGSDPDAAPSFGDASGNGTLPSSGTPAGSAAPGFISDPELPGLPTDEGATVTSTTGCTKVDFLFVVDNSLSMLEEQTALVNSFPGFMRVVEQQLGASDFHVMVVDTDASDVREAIAALLGQNGDVCGPTLGAGRRQNQAGEDCGLISDRRYMDAGQPDLTAAFSCVAQVGTLGSPREAPVDAMLASLAPSLNAAGGCNAGFLRDDAILVVTLIGDEDDGVSSGDPTDWRDALVGAKAGSADSIVFLGLIGGAPGASPAGAAGGTCDASEVDPAPRLHSLIESFSFGSVGDICAADYAPFFETAVSVIDTACEDFQPVIR